MAVFSACLLAVCAFAQSKPAPSTPDYSQEAFVAESILARFSFEDDGTGTRELTTRFRILTDAGVQHWGLLAIGYAQANERLEIAYVRVRKPDGAVVITPAENIQDMPSDVSRAAPMYSDLRQKHVAVKGLNVGDTLEYSVQWRTHTAQVPGQFWINYDFMRDGIALDEQLEVSVIAW